MPDCLKPPNGMFGSSMLCVLTQTVPAAMRGSGAARATDRCSRCWRPGRHAGQAHRVVQRVEGLGHHHRAEDLLAHDAGIGPDVGEHRGPHEIARAAPASPPAMTRPPRRGPGRCSPARAAGAAQIPADRPACRRRSPSPASCWRPRRPACATFWYRPRCTYRREPAVQTWPWLKKIAAAAPCTARSTSQSSSTITGDLPPSSSDTRFMSSTAARPISLPTSVEPVKAILSTPGCATSAAPAVSPGR